MDFEKTFKGLSDALRTCNDAPGYLDCFKAIEGLEIPLEQAYPWPSFLSQLFRDLLEKRSRVPTGDLVDQSTRLLLLQRKWDRRRIAAVGYQWSQCFPSGTQCPISTPPEILHHILSSHVADTDGTVHKDWGEQVDFLCNCALVSRAWNVQATAILYAGCIRLSNMIGGRGTSIRAAIKVLRTLAADERTARGVGHLVITAFPPGTDLKFSQGVIQILEKCPNVRILQLSGFPYDFPGVYTPGPFCNLHALQLRDVNLRKLAPLLSNSSRLTSLHLWHLEIFSGRPRRFTKGAEPPADSLEDIPTPAYRLTQLHLRLVKLSTAQLVWLLGGTERLDSLSLQDIYVPSLGAQLGGRVNSLQLTTVPSLAKMEQDLAATLQMFTTLKSLQLVGEGWPLSPLLLSITSSLKRLAILRSSSAAKALVEVLTDRSWQSDLEELTVSVADSVDPDIDSGVQVLRDLCIVRNIHLQFVSTAHAIHTATPFAPLVEFLQ
ncbi:hypothetical protein C8R46DRAFT_1081991 [Mycena filopes]|nr:hypothetical protein C8R46DRAFT_1081991 [Mycena filopes]